MKSENALYHIYTKEILGDYNGEFAFFNVANTNWFIIILLIFYILVFRLWIWQPIVNKWTKLSSFS